MPEIFRSSIEETFEVDFGISSSNLVRRNIHIGDELNLQVEKHHRGKFLTIVVYGFRDLSLDSNLDDTFKAGYLERNLSLQLLPLIGQGQRIDCQYLGKKRGSDKYEVEVKVYSPEETDEIKRQIELKSELFRQSQQISSSLNYSKNNVKEQVIPTNNRIGLLAKKFTSKLLSKFRLQKP